MAVARLLVCATCDRYAAPRPSPTRGEALIAALREAAGGIPLSLRVVECLNGCPKPCTVALRAPGKASLRFSEIAPADAPALIALAHRYAGSADGEVADAALPEALRLRLTVHTPAPARAGAQQEPV
jgi:predicted metal-binding protein